MFVYARSAIDYWPGWISEEAFLRELNDEYSVIDPADYQSLKQKAFELAHKVGWEGDIREGPFVAGLPPQGPEPLSDIIIAWKQDNNGDTFIASPIRLSWLEDGDYGKWVEG
jgi:hypothetical protein